MPEIIVFHCRSADGQLDLRQQTLATHAILRLLRQPEPQASEGHSAPWHWEALTVVPA